MTVSTLVEDAREYVSEVLEGSLEALEDANALVMGVGYVVPGYFPATLPNAPPQAIDIEAPTLADVPLDLPTEPSDELIFQDIAPLEPGDAPVFDAVAPTIIMPTAPSQLAEFTEGAPGIDTSLEFPDPPSELMNPLLAAPVIADRAEPQKPTVALPGFDAVAPVDDTVAPTNLQATMENAYRTALPASVAMANGYVDAMLVKWNPQFHIQMGRIETQLTRYLDGGTGFAPAVESAMLERTRDKQAAEALQLREATYREAADAGFTIPSGALLSQIQRARQAGADASARAATEIVILQAELEQKNLQFAVTQSAGLRLAMVNATLGYMQNLVSLNGQALDYAKAVLSSVIETYNIAARVFAVKLEAYKAEAMVFETRLKSAMAGIELYRAEIQALEAMVTVDRTKVEIYKARIDSLAAYANVYRSQIDAVLGRAQLEKLKLDVYQAKVQAFTARVQAKNGEWMGYRAAIDGETAKANLFRIEADAFSAESQAYRSSVEAKAEVVRAAAITNRARADQHNAKLESFKTVVQARGEQAKIRLENQRHEILAFQAQTEKLIADAKVLSEYYRVTSNAAISNAEMRFKVQVEEANSRREFSKAIAELAQLSARIQGQLAASAMSGMNTLVAETRNE